MNIVDISSVAGRTYPARRRTRSLVGPGLPIDNGAFSLGYVELEPKGGQVPWHNQEQVETYFLIEGECEMCVGTEREILRAGQIVEIPTGVFHQITNVSERPARMIYTYAPGGDVAHWRQELAGTLPRAGVDAPPLPAGAWPQCTDAPE